MDTREEMGKPSETGMWSFIFLLLIIIFLATLIRGLPLLTKCSSCVAEWFFVFVCIAGIFLSIAGIFCLALRRGIEIGIRHEKKQKSLEGIEKKILKIDAL